ncbi:MAG: hydroxyacid-oxoacid transhydrogenase [Haloarculaceae archaeon]
MTYQPESVWEFSIADNVTFGVGAVEEVSDAVAERGASSVLVVTDRGVAEAGVLDTVTDALGDVEYAVFDEVDPDPSLDVFENAVEVANESDPDAVVGVGGGSSMDVAKTTGIVAEHGGEVLDYVAPPTGGGEPVPGPGVPTVCLPTTAGTGSEVSPVSVISLPDEDLKVGISSPHQRPDVALVDPALTVTLPPGPTASSGIDALSHAIEAYTTRRYDAKPAPESRSDRPDYNGRSTLTDALAHRAIELVGNNLRDAVDNGQDLEARRAMALGSLLAGAAFTNAGVGATHAIAMAAGAIHHTPHGVTIALAMPAVMRFNATSAPDRYAEIADLLGEDLTATGRHEAAEAAARGVERLAADVGIDGGLSSLGLEPEDVDHVAERASKLERLTVGNPRRIDREDLESIVRDAI